MAAKKETAACAPTDAPKPVNETKKHRAIVVNHDNLTPAMALMAARFDTLNARVIVLAIGLQESGLEATVQAGGGPAHGYWQFEGGPLSGVAEVMLHDAQVTGAICRACAVPFTREVIHKALAVDQVLAAALARRLLWTDPQPLPELGDIDGAWKLYLRKWGPGKPRPEHWQENYRAAASALGINL